MNEFTKFMLAALGAIIFLALAIEDYLAGRMLWSLGSSCIGLALGIWANVVIWRLWRGLRR